MLLMLSLCPIYKFRPFRLLVGAALLTSLLGIAAPLIHAADEQPQSPAWGGEPVKRTWGSPDSQEEFEEQLRERAEEGSELMTAPLAEDETAPAEKPTAVPTPTPGANRQRVMQFIYKPKVSAQPTPEPMEGEELDTEPLAAVEGPVQRLGSVRARLDRSTVHLDESFALIVEITVTDLTRLPLLKPPRLPDLNLINAYQSQTRVSRQGAVWWMRTQGFVFLARRPGRFTLPSMSLNYAGQTLRTPALEIEVEGSRSGQSYRSPLSGERYQEGAMVPGAPDTGMLEEEGQENEFSASVSAAKAYVNQQVILTVHLAYTVNERTAVAYRPPVSTGFITEELPEEKSEELISGAKLRSVSHRYRTALFAVRPGGLTLGPGQAIFSDAGSSRTLQTDPLLVEVVPLPPDPEADETAGSSGLVGAFQLAAEPPEALRAGSPGRIQLRLSGTGNLRAAPEPVWAVPAGSRLFLETRQDELQPQAEGLYGTRTYSYWLVCDQPGALRLGPARVRYFDPAQNRWLEARADLPLLSIAPKPEAVAAGPSPSDAARKLSLRPDRSSTRPLRPAPAWKFATVGFWAWQVIGPAMLGLLWWARRQQQKALAEASTLRVRRAYGQARKSLRQLKGYIHRREDQKFYDGVSRTAAEYLSAKLNQPSVFVNLDRLPDFFGPYHVPAELLSRFRIALTAIEYVRYAAVVLPNKDMEALHRDLENAIEQFEKFWQNRPRQQRPPAASLVILATLTSLAGAAWGQEGELHRLRGATLAERGELAAAEAEYRQVLNLGLTDPEVFYNLGNVYLRQGKVGLSVLAYERGLRQSPRDPDLRYNLVQALSVVAQAPDAPPQRRPGWSGSLYRLATANELAVAASAAYYLALLLAGLAAWWPKKFGPWRWGVWLAAGLALAFAAWSAARQFEPQWRKQGVVLVAGTEVHSRPYTQAETLYTLPEGAQVRVRAEEEAWVEVFFAPNRQGWVSRSTLGWIE